MSMFRFVCRNCQLPVNGSVLYKAGDRTCSCGRKLTTKEISDELKKIIAILDKEIENDRSNE